MSWGTAYTNRHSFFKAASVREVIEVYTGIRDLEMPAAGQLVNEGAKDTEGREDDVAETFKLSS